MPPIKDLNSLLNELEKWRDEKRLANAVLVVRAALGGVSLWIKGEVEDTSGLRLLIAGWGRGSFILAGTEFNPKLDAGLKASIDDLQGGAPIDWTTAIPLALATGALLVLWSEPGQ